jgi:hypothetical protein
MSVAPKLLVSAHRIFMIGFADHVLPDLIELVDTEDAACVFAIGASLFAEAGAIADEGQRQIFVAENFICCSARASSIRRCSSSTCRSTSSR